jgi:nicotinamide mononucleotide transporter
MQSIIGLFDMNTVIGTVWGYKLSALELAGVLTGLICVWFTARENILCWPFGIANSICFFIMFYQLRLYSDMFLQVYFFITCVYGWWKWANPPSRAEANQKNELRISRMGKKNFAIAVGVTFLGAAAFGTLIKNIHIFWPSLFPVKAAFPYADSVVAVGSITAQLIMAWKKLENWIIWISIDVLATGIYFMKGINLVAIEYIVFAGIASYGLLGWKKELANYAHLAVKEAEE